MISSPLFLLLLLLLATLPSARAYLKYNEIRQKDAHNSYERHEGLLDQMIYHHCRTIEIDSHLGFTAGLYSVYHDAGLFQSYSSFNRLRDGVKLLHEFHSMFPNHHVVTVFMDLKGGFKEPKHSPEDFDSIIGQLPLWTPADAQGNASSIQAGIDQNGWPEIEDMRGRFIWILTHGQDGYCASNEACAIRKSFVAADSGIATEADIGKWDYKVFYNMKSTTQGHLGHNITNAGYVGRMWDPEDINTEEKWQGAKEGGWQHITTDRVNWNRDSFSRTHNEYGYPFETLNGLDVSKFTPQDEGGRVIYMYADSEDGGDAWGRQDNAQFAANLINDDPRFNGSWVNYTTSISLVNSHCDEFAKAGIMLRQEDDRFPLGSGQYFGVIRTCDELIRVQYRERAYMLTVAKRLTPTAVDGIEQAKRVGIKVRYRYDGTDSHVEGYFKLEGFDADEDEAYVLIHEQTFPDVQLNIHGLFVSNHYWVGNDDGTPFKALFINTKLNDKPVFASNFTEEYGFEDAGFGDGYFPDPNTPTSFKTGAIRSELD